MIIWATCGLRWGFRFLLDGGEADPLPAYERAFAGAEDAPTVYRRAGRAVTLRFPDPQGRRDGAGRVIPHDLVLRPPLADDVRSLGDGRRLFERLLAGAYEQLVDGPGPPTSADVDRAFDGRRP